MFDLVHHPLDTGEWVGLVMLVSIVCGSAIAIVGIVTDHLRRSRLDDMKATLKMEMIQRGMSVDDINKVLQNPSREVEREMAAQSAGRAHGCRGGSRWRNRHSEQA